ncbi:TPA_asm: hypothetical protein G2974_23405, partial [Salmonella enterica subsp. diarizonae]|nr:hypothetical protein [Salmonella enterica subsp. diarizonae]
MKKLIAAAFIILPLASCTVYGNKSIKDETQQNIASKIINGKTTQKDILQLYGEPQTKETNDGKELWGYSVMSGESQISNYIPGLALLKNSSTAHMKELEIWFKGDVVERYTFR